MTIDLRAAQTTAVQIAHQAADILVEYFEGPVHEMTKESPYDIVTEADKGAEALVVEAIQSAFPDHHIVGEEGGGQGAPVDEADYRWYIDPLDGTTNFVNHIPFFSVSLTLTDRHMAPLVGVVYSPMMDELFTVVRGEGAMFNGKLAQVSPDTELKTAVLSTGFPYDKYTSPDNNLAEWGRLLIRTRALRCLGSAALDLCYVAIGRLEGYWELKINPWDCLAGALCVMEAGGMVSDQRGSTNPSVYSWGPIVATNGHIHQQTLDVMADRV